MHKVKIEKGMTVSEKEAAKMKKRPGGSNVGKYKDVPKKDFAGPSGGAPSGSYPIPNVKKAKAALSYAHNAPNPKGIKEKVYSTFPRLRKTGEPK